MRSPPVLPAVACPRRYGSPERNTMSPHDVTRRAALGVVGAGSVIALAGCAASVRPVDPPLAALQALHRQRQAHRPHPLLPPQPRLPLRPLEARRITAESSNTKSLINLRANLSPQRANSRRRTSQFRR